MRATPISLTSGASCFDRARRRFAAIERDAIATAVRELAAVFAKRPVRVEAAPLAEARAETTADVRAAVQADVQAPPEFLRWIPQRKEAEATAKGVLQLNGIPELDPSKIAGRVPEPAKPS